MKRKLIIPLLLVTQLSLAKSTWGLKPDIESRLIVALDLLHAQKVSTRNKMAGFVTVGDDSSCDFRVGATKIQNAIDSGAHEIRIASNDTYQETITINDPLVNLTIRGGFSSCTAAENNIQSDLQQDWTQITRTNGQGGPIFSITGLHSENMTVFENITLIGGDGQGSTSGGSLRVENTESNVLLQNVRLTGGVNMATGGGLSVISSNATVILRNTSIDNNQTSSNGGGIYCNDFSGANKFTSIILDKDSAITGNVTQNHGGGAYLEKNCLLSVFSGSSTPFPAPKNKPNTTPKGIGILVNNSGVTLNSANGFGGGVYLSGGAGLLVYGNELCTAEACFGDNANPANIVANSSNQDMGAPSGNGGGIYATGMNTDVTIAAGLIAANKVLLNSGGAIALLDSANLTVSRNGSNCWDAVRCNYFGSNTASQNGGVLYNDNATANISHAYFEGSRASIGVAIYSTNNAITNVDTSVFDHNGLGGDAEFFDGALIFATSGADMEMKYVTIADNDVTVGVFRIENDIGTSLLLNSSIVDDINSGPVIASSGASSGFVFANCVMAHETNTLNDSNNTIDDPEFVNRNNFNYHLSNTSPAIDYCNTLTTSTNKDMDFQGRGWDNPNLSNFIGSYDIGADENFSKNYFTIGSDAGCDFDSDTQTIQDVIDTGVGEVRIAHNGFYDSAIVINDISVKLRGGFLDCNAADANNSTTHTTIDAPGGVNIPAIDIQGINLGNSIFIEGLTITGDDSNFSAISANGAVAEVTLNDLTITGHNIDEFTFGGGINISGGAIDLILNDTLIFNNSANRGGGIYCDGSFSSITIKGDSGISHNISQDKGGGFYMTNGCELTIYSGESNPDASTNLGVSDNLSYDEGGGIYADLGAQVTLYGHEFCDSNGCVGNNTNPVNINNNTSGFSGSPTSDDRGGGIYASGQGTTVNIYAGLLQENSARSGGALYINDFASLNVSRLSADCWDVTKCNYFFNNSAYATGAAIQSDQGQINISSSYFEENEGSSTSGSVLYALGASSFARFEGSVFNNNNNVGSSDQFVIRAVVGATVEVVHSTFADNFIQNSATFGVTTNSVLRLYSSIVNDPQGFVLNSTGTATLNCVMVHDSSFLLGTNIIQASPGFVDRNNRDYHLTANAQAKDVCDDSVSQIQFKDIDFEQRGFDDPLSPNIMGSFDVGADEALVELIFSNGFE